MTLYLCVDCIHGSGRLFAHAKVLAGFIVDDTAGLITVELGWANDKIGHIEGKETFAVETARVALRQHKGFADIPLGIDVTEIGPCEQPIVATGTKHEPTGVGAPVVERFRSLRVGSSHKMALSCREVEQIEVGLVMPDAELSVVGEGVAQEMSVVGGTGEGN